VRAAVLGDPPVLGRLAAGLTDPRVQPEVADQLVRRREAVEFADRGHDRQRDGRVDAGNRHQSRNLAALQADPPKLEIDQAQLLAGEVELTQQRRDRLGLIARQLLLGEPRPALAPEQIRRRAAGNEVAMQDRVDPVLQPRALSDDVRAASDLASQRVSLIVGQPHRRQEARRQQLREHLRVDLVGLDLRLGDRARLGRVRDNHLGHVTLQQPGDRVRVARRLQRDLVTRRQALRE
jgi:hypothetical protein